MMAPLPSRFFAPCAALLLVTCGAPPKSTDTVFVSNEASNVVTLVDGVSGRIEGQLSTGPRPRGMAFSTDGRTFYVAASNANRIEAWEDALHCQ